jgi:hypothetical protein
VEPRKQALYVATCAAVIGFALMYVAPELLEVPLVRYYPLEHRWALEPQATALAMDWYGRSLAAAVAGGVCFALGRWLALRTAPVRARVLTTWAVGAAGATLFAMVVQAHELAGRVPVPEPLPAWYVPR